MRARLPTSAVNIDATTPIMSVTAKPRTGPEPKTNSIAPAMNMVMFESPIAEKAFSKPALIAAQGEAPTLSSSRMRS